ncbi:MAG: efflux RND transporter permease subunit [Candidatus Absconditabacterales bacterium]|nr:efflux RND transporter permease subunit [Candidatus Absconditabacterales bacterium]
MSFIVRLENTFLGFWVKQRRVSFLVLLLVLMIGIYSLIVIPKESSPDVSIGIIVVTIPYRGVDPITIDTLITQEVQTELADIEGIKKITSTSTQGSVRFSIELENETDVRDALSDVREAVNRANLPVDADDPIIVEAKPDKRLFTLVLKAPADLYGPHFFKEQARKIQEELEGKLGIKEIQIAGGTDIDLVVMLNQGQMELMGLTLANIASQIRSMNANQALGNYRIDDVRYDIRIDGEIKTLDELRQLPIALPAGGTVTLGSLGTIAYEDADRSLRFAGSYQLSGLAQIELTFIKQDGPSIFRVADDAKLAIENIMKRQEFAMFSYDYIQDQAETIKKDYVDLANNGLSTIALVFLCMLIFVGFKESAIAAISIPLAFCITFFVLWQLGLSMNFLTNFSLIICFGIAIDTTLVIIEGAHENLKLGFKPKHAVLLAVHEYKYSLIAGTATTCFAFLPMLTLPGILGKFLAYIPITIFVTLLAGLAVSLTLNSALYYKLTGKQKYYVPNPEREAFFDNETKAQLSIDRQGLVSKTQSLGIRERALEFVSQGYQNVLRWITETSKKRVIFFSIPFLMLVMSFVLIARFGKGFELFPASDADFFTISIEGRQGTTTDAMIPYAERIQEILSQYPSIETRSMTILDQSISVSINLFEKKIRQTKELGTVFSIQDRLADDLAWVLSEGLSLDIRVPRGGPPPSGGAAGIKLIAQSSQQLDELIRVSNDFESYLKTLDTATNVDNSSKQTPGEVIFRFDKNQLANIGLTQQDFFGELFAMTRGIQAGSIKDTQNDYIIYLRLEEFDDRINLDNLVNARINTRAGQIRLGDVASYTLSNAVQSVSRENQALTITVSADPIVGLTPDKVQTPLITFASTYDFPEGISFSAGGENEENKDLLIAMGIAFLVAVICIYGVLVLQFNSYFQPSVIMYSVLMSLIGVNIGLVVTNNAFGLPVIIGFIALTGIVVNDAIVFVEKYNTNRERGMDTIQAVLEAGKSRLQPIILTTITTVLGLVSVARQDEFFAGLAYTIMFGLFMGSFMTLIAIPILLIDAEKLKLMLKRSIIKCVVFLSFISICSIPFSLILFLVGQPWIIGIVGGIIIFFVLNTRWFTRTHTFYLQSLLGYRVLGSQSSSSSTKESAMQSKGHIHESHKGRDGQYHPGLYALMSQVLIIFPFLLGLLVASRNRSVGILLIVLYLLANMISVWLSPSNQALHDRILKTRITQHHLDDD